jgi:hypothetical protein
MKAKQDWKYIGRFVGTLVQLFTIISATFKKAEVGLEVIEWLVGSGKDFLVGKIEEIALEYRKQNPPEKPLTVQSMLKAEIDLDKTPQLPFEGAIIENHACGGKVIIEKRIDGLYIDGKKIILHRSNRQLNGKYIKGDELREELTGKPVLNATVLDFLLEHKEYIPEDWKKDENGNTLYIFFWGTICRDSGRSLCVRYLCWRDGRWCQDYYWLGDGWYGDDPAAVSAS